MGFLREIPSGAKQIHVILLLYVYTHLPLSASFPFFFTVWRCKVLLWWLISIIICKTMVDLRNVYRQTFSSRTTHKCSFGSLCCTGNAENGEILFLSQGSRPGKDRLCRVLEHGNKGLFLLLRERVDFFLLNQSTWRYRYIVQFISGWDINMGGIANGWMDNAKCRDKWNLQYQMVIWFWDIFLESFLLVYRPEYYYDQTPCR